MAPTPPGVERVTAAGRERACPVCGSRDVARIQFGYPRFDADLEASLATGEVVLGGCLVTGDDPSRLCNACGARFAHRGHAG